MSWYALPVTGRAHSFERSPIVSDCGLVDASNARQSLMPTELRVERVQAAFGSEDVAIPTACCGLCRRAVRARARRRIVEKATRSA